MEEDRSGSSETKRTEAGFITKASAWYCDKFPLRAVIQAIPGSGSLVDTMLAGLGSRWQYKRLEDFISKLNERLIRLEQLGNLISIGPSEPLFDFMMQVFDQVIRARSEEKRKRFANLVANQVANRRVWDEVEEASRLIGELSDLDIMVLDVSLKARPCEEPFDELRVVTISDRYLPQRKSSRYPSHLKWYFPSLSQAALRMICSGLVSRGLLYDEGVGRVDTKAMEYFVATDLAKWLMDWIS